MLLFAVILRRRLLFYFTDKVSYRRGVKLPAFLQTDRYYANRLVVAALFLFVNDTTCVCVCVCVCVLPLGHEYEGEWFEKMNCGVSIMRNG